MQSFISKQFLTFLLMGGIAAGVNFFSRIFYNQWMSFSTAIIIAYITGMITAFILMKFFVFKKSEHKLHNSIGIFILINLAAIIQVWLVSMLFDVYVLPSLNITSFAPEIAHLAGIVVPTFTSYFGHKHGSFR